MKHFLCAAAAALIAGAGTASAVTLTTGTGDGGVTLNVDLVGNFTSALFNPPGPIGTADTVFDSGLYWPAGTLRTRLSDGNATLVSASDTEVVSSFTFTALAIRLTQTLSPSFDGGSQVGSALTQSFQITNNNSVPTSFELVRYLDGDLAFDGSIADSGGRTSVGSNLILFEVDSSSANDAAVTSLGISASGGTTPVGFFEIEAYSELRTKIENGFILDNTIAGDNDGDGFIDTPYDVTLGLSRFMRFEAGQTLTYTTTTLFGNAVPPVPGQTEALPLLPDSLGPNGGFEFEIPADAFDEGQTIFIDPVIAVGYTYEVTGAEFTSVTAPSIAAVPDGIYTLMVDGFEFELLAGQTHVFGTPVSLFEIAGIDLGLALDPEDGQAFVTGITLAFTSDIAVVTQTPTRIDTDPSAVPLPAGALLLLSGFGSLGACRRRRHAA